MTAAPFLQAMTWRSRSEGREGEVSPSVDEANRIPFLEWSSNFLHAFIFVSSWASSGADANLSKFGPLEEILSASWSRKEDLEDLLLLLSSSDVSDVMWRRWRFLDQATAMLSVAGIDAVWRPGMVAWFTNAHSVSRMG